MDIASFAGFFAIIGVFCFGVMYENGKLVPLYLQYMWNAPSAIIVVLGTLAATLAASSLDEFLQLGKIIGRVYKKPKVALLETLVVIVDVAKIARKNVLAIEDSLSSIENTFLRNALRLVVDRVDRELITEIMVSEIKYTMQKKDKEIELINRMSTLAPAFGMIGTLIGLVLMLQSLSDVSTIGPKMSVALITTLYGSLLSNGIFLPWSATLESRMDEQRTVYEVVRDGVLFIEQNERPEFIEQDLMNYLPPGLRSKYEALKFSSEKGGE